MRVLILFMPFCFFSSFFFLVFWISIRLIFFAWNNFVTIFIPAYLIRLIEKKSRFYFQPWISPEMYCVWIRINDIGPAWLFQSLLCVCGCAMQKQQIDCIYLHKKSYAGRPYFSNDQISNDQMFKFQYFTFFSDPLPFELALAKLSV